MTLASVQTRIELSRSACRCACADNGGRDFAELPQNLSKMYLKCISSASK